MTLRWVGPGLGVALLFACGKSETTPPPTQTAPEAGIPAPVKDAGPPDVFKGPLAIVEESKLGCPGDVAVDGAPIDIAESLGYVFVGEASLVPLNDGTYRMFSSAYGDISMLHLDGSLKKLSEDVVGSVPIFGNSFAAYQNVRTPKGAALGIQLGEETGAKRNTAAFFEQDLLTGDVVGFPVNDKVDGEQVVNAKMLTDGATTTAWLMTKGAGFGQYPVYRRTLDAAQWQRTDLTSIPSAAWIEAGKTHLLHSYRDLVLDGDGKTESDATLPYLAPNPAICDSSSLVRTSSGFVTTRTISAPVPCAEQNSSTAPYEYWIHFPAQGPGRKVGEIPKPTSDPQGPRVFMDFWRGAANVTHREPTTPGAYRFRIQRLDAKMENLGKELVIDLDGTWGDRHLAAIENGYMLFVDDQTADQRNRVRAIRLKCI